MAMNRKHTPEEIRKISASMKGKTKSPEVRQKISDTMKQWAINNPSEMQVRINRLTEYQREARDLMKLKQEGKIEIK